MSGHIRRADMTYRDDFIFQSLARTVGNSSTVSQGQAEMRPHWPKKDGHFDRPVSHRAVSCAERAHGSIQQCDPISSCCSRSIEVFPELRQRRGTYDLPGPGLINAALTAKADLNFA
ncbi:hypothetical protein [Bradyrhizobium septentrionale]|uniref:Uncharacterized protein n=1 Tax=Bradyrhizobium septentrionale TaxID=1404411 RepID=A0ABZ2P661_9BRAD